LLVIAARFHRIDTRGAVSVMTWIPGDPSAADIGSGHRGGETERQVQSHVPWIASIHRPSDSGQARHNFTSRGNLLSNLTVSIGNVRLSCKFEVERVDELDATAVEAEAHPRVSQRLRRILRQGISSNPRLHRPNLRGAPHRDQINSHDAGVHGQLNAPRAALWEADDPVVRAALRKVMISQAIAPGYVYGSLPDGTTADWSRIHRSAAGLGRHSHPLSGENCTVVLSDVTAFGARTRTDKDRRIIREALFGITHAALRGIPDVWSWDDRGDGLLTVVPPSVPTAEVIGQLHRSLPAALDDHNRTYHDSAQIRLRVAVNVGPVATDSIGLSGEAIIVTARLIEAPLFKKAMDTRGASLGVIASTFIYETVIRHDPDLTGYACVRVDVKETTTPAWMKVFGAAVAP
jgi:hypothetical protein